MERFLQALGAILISSILSLILAKRDKSYASMLSMTVCAIVLFLGLRYLEPVVDFLQDLEKLGNLQPELVKILLKAGGIGILTEITVLFCADSGNASLGQCLRILSTAVILWISLPVFRALLELIQNILEGI